jgi:hypothetical protein
MLYIGSARPAGLYASAFARSPAAGPVRYGTVLPKAVFASRGHYYYVLPSRAHLPQAGLPDGNGRGELHVRVEGGRC